MPAKRLRLYPRGWPGARHWVYLFGAKDGSLKVGRTSDPRGRLRAHGVGRMTWYHIGPSGDANFAIEVEREMIQALANIGRRVSLSETFRGITRDQALTALRSEVARRGA